MLRTFLVVLSLLLPQSSLSQGMPPRDAGVSAGALAQPAAAPSDGLGLHPVLEPAISGPSSAAAPSAAPSGSAAPGSEGVIPTVGEVKQVVDALPVIKEVIQAPTVFGVCSAVALVVNLFINYLRKRGNLASRKRVKQFLAFAVALSGGLALVTPGMSWAMAAFVALSPLFAVVGHEIFRSDK